MYLRDPDLIIENKYRIYEVKSWLEAVFFGDGSGWCIANSKPEYEDYTEHNPLSIIHTKTGGKWRPYLCISKSKNRVYMKKRGNAEANYYSVCTQHPSLKPWLKTKGLSTPWPSTFRTSSDLSLQTMRDAFYAEAISGWFDMGRVFMSGNHLTRQPRWIGWDAAEQSPRRQEPNIVPRENSETVSLTASSIRRAQEILNSERNRRYQGLEAFR
jgi:hypothetical protein